MLVGIYLNKKIKTLFVEGSALFIVLFGQLRIDVFPGLFLLFQFFEFIQIISDLTVIILQQTLLQKIDGLTISLQL